jgi:protein involved in polysaccharide export with SLBB domain
MTWNKTCLYTCFVLIFFTACTSSKKYDYFQANYNSKDKSTVLPFDVATAPIHIIDIGDVIEINYYTPDEINQSIMNTSDESEKKSKINLFTVNSDGYIEIPLIGSCKVIGSNIDEVKDTVSTRISKYFNISYIQVKLYSFKINVIGEVTNPGIKNIQSNEINIPLIGTCKVLGCNIDDVKDTVTNRISKYFNIAYIQVKLNSFKINIIGEVTTPGIKNIYSSEKILFKQSP